MSSVARAVLFVVAVAGLSGAVFFVTRSAPMRAPAVRSPEPPGREADRAAPAATGRGPSGAAPADVAAAPAPLPAAMAPESTTEESMAAAVHALEDTEPQRALELTRRAQALWPSGVRAPEFAAAEVKCLYRLGRPSEGRGAAEAMVNKYPDSPWAAEVERQTGAHIYVDH